MNTTGKIAAFGVALAAAFSGAYGIGKGVGPVDAGPRPTAHGEHGKHASGEPGRSGGGAAELPGGLQVSDRGYHLDLRTPRIEAGRSERLRFTVRDREGRAVTAYEREHDKELHLILASRDLGTFRHLHPSRAADGTWSIRTELPRSGDYRLFADFTPRGGNGLTLGADLAVSGAYTPRPLPPVSRTATVDGYKVRLTGALKPGSPRDLELDVTRKGRPVTDLQPYLGAYGHLVALRAGDLAYLHVHPNGEPGDGKTEAGPGISFSATAPSAGSYRLFLDFKHEGKVRTAAFTVRTDGGAAAAAPAEKPGKDAPGTGDPHQHAR